MSAFFELRIYQVFPGKMIEWLELMENTIIPYQVSKGMIIHGSFTENSFDRFHLSNEKREMETLENRNLYISMKSTKKDYTSIPLALLQQFRMQLKCVCICNSLRTNVN